MGGRTGQGDFYRQRRRVLLGIATAVAVTIAAASALWLLPAAIALDSTVEGRFRLGAAAAVLPAAVVVIHVGRIASRRFNAPDLIDGAAFDVPGSLLAVDRALLANAVEQAVIAIPTYMLLVLVLPAEHLVAVPMLAVLFVLGRTLFAARYRSGPSARSFGFALTFYPTVVGMVAGAAMLVM